VKKKSDNIRDLRISESQRQCLSHILRNCEQAIEGVVAVVENRAIFPSTEDIAQSLENVEKKLARVIETAKRGSFCALTPQDCQFVSPFVACCEERVQAVQNSAPKLKVVGGNL
jgi:hypothetical protein